AQVCRVPQFTDVTVSGGSLRPVAWNGTSGGVIAFFANGTVTLSAANSPINAGGTGFRGGSAHSALNPNQNVTALNTSVDDGGSKGEGIDGSQSGLYGRGNVGNGGGGGNAYKAGGGGGSDGGSGG